MWKDLLINFREYLFMNVTLDLVMLYKILKQHKKFFREVIIFALQYIILC